MKKSLFIIALSCVGTVAFGQNISEQDTLKQGAAKHNFEDKKVETKLKMRLAKGALKAQADSDKEAGLKSSQDLKAIETKQK